jgi:hypothetical protein
MKLHAKLLSLLVLLIFSTHLKAGVYEDESGRYALLELRARLENLELNSANLNCKQKSNLVFENTTKLGRGDNEARKAIIDLRKQMFTLESGCGLAEKFSAPLDDWSLLTGEDENLRRAILDMRQRIASLSQALEQGTNVKRKTQPDTEPIRMPTTSAGSQSQLPLCSGKDARRWTNCSGVHNFSNGDRYEGEFKDGKFNGWGTYFHLSNNQFRGDKYTGQFMHGSRHGSGRYTAANGLETLEGIWNSGVFVRAEKVNLPAPTDFALLEERKRIEQEKLRLAEERRQMDEERKRRETAKANAKIDLRISVSEPDLSGLVSFSIQTGVDTSSLKINGDEQGGNEIGVYQLKRLPKVGQDTTYNIVAVDGYGNTAKKSIVLKGQSVATAQAVTSLNPENIKKSATRDAVAIIVGIQDYKRLPKADFANDDARAFYDYAVRALGIKPENIKMLIDGEAEQVEMLSAFKSWLPSYVKKEKTDVYVFYSGHGLPSTDGKSLFLLPQNGHKDYLSETGIDQSSLVAAITAAKPKSVTLFIDSCYSGSTRSGETLLASARPIVLKANENIFPGNFTVITASSLDQISSSSPELKHGIFSFYVMKGLEGAADLDGDGKITAGELQNYLMDMVPRHAMKMNRKQEPQLVGDAERVLVVK